MEKYNKDILGEIIAKINKNTWLCFMSGIVIGIITHIYMLTNKLPNWDDICGFAAYGSGDGHGRWMLKYLANMAGSWSVPALNGMIAIVLLAIASCFIYETLELKTVTSAILIPAVMLTFPAVASMLTFMFTADMYGVAILLSCIGTWMLQKYRYGIVPAVILFIISMGIYQSYICLAAGILVFVLVKDLFQEKDIITVFKKGCLFLASLIVSMGTYVFITKFIVGNLFSYRGIDKMGQIEVTQFPRLIARAYKRILEYFVIKPWSFMSDFGHKINICIILLIVILFFILIKDKYIYKDIKKTIFICILILLEPMALAAVYIMVPDAENYSLLMLFQYFFIYIVAISLLELFMEKEQKVRCICGGLISIIILLVCYDNYVLTNSAYFRMDIANKRILSFYERLYNRIEEQEGYQIGDAIAILGDYWPEKNILSSYGIDMERYEEMEGIAMENGLFTSAVRENYLKIYLGIDAPYPGLRESREIMEKDIFIQMPSYPAQESIKQIDGIWVVKIADIPK